MPVILPQPDAHVYAVGYYHGRSFNKPRCPWTHPYFKDPYEAGFKKGQEDKANFNNRFDQDYDALVAKKGK